MTIRPFLSGDLEIGLLETLESLAPVGLEKGRAGLVAKFRRAMGILTYVATEVVNEQERVVGTASLTIEQKFIHNGGIVGRIEDVAVHKDFMRRGIGKALVQECISRAKSVWCYKVLLSCSDQNIPFYEHLGFTNHENEMRLDLR